MPTTHTTKKEASAKPVAAKAPRAKKVAPEVAELPKLRIRIRAYEHKILDASLKQIMDTAMRYDVEVQGPIPLPTEIKKYTVNRSTFIFKNAREQFEMRIHKRIIDILNPNQEVIESLRDLNLPSGVDITIKI